MTALPATSFLLPPDETERLHTLHTYANAACLYEPVFDGFVDLAACIFNLPVAFISLVDADEVLYKFNTGLPQLVRYPRGATVCALTIQHNKALFFNDLTHATQQARLTEAAVQNVQANGMVFYATVPLRMPDQRPIGTLCLVGHEPRPFCADEQHVLEQLAELVERTIVIRQMCLTIGWLGAEHWSRIQTTLTEGLWEMAVQVRHLLQGPDGQMPVSTNVLQPMSWRLAELHNKLTVHPGSML